MFLNYEIHVLTLGFFAYSCYTQDLEAPEGCGCTVGKYNGTCLNMYNCYHMIQDIKDRVQPKYKSVNSTKPSAKKMVQDGLSVTKYGGRYFARAAQRARDAVLDPQAGVRWKNGEKAWDKCLDYFKVNDYPCKQHYSAKEPKRWNDKKKCHDIEISAVGAAGGEDAGRGEFPHMALLGYGSELEAAQWLCGGSLISEDFILTAGHCTASAQLGPVRYAALGILKRSDPPELWQRYNIRRIVPHPGYRSPSKYHDIALLETETRVKFSRAVLPVCLPVDKSIKMRRDNLGIAAGWGALGHRRELADILQKVYLREFKHEECAAIYEPHRHLLSGFDNSTQMCFGDHDKPRDTCRGDSGGPLQYEDGCLSYVIGVTSYGVPCGFPGNAGMYTRVAHYVPWIESIVWP